MHVAARRSVILRCMAQAKMAFAKQSFGFQNPLKTFVRMARYNQTVLDGIVPGRFRHRLSCEPGNKLHALRSPPADANNQRDAKHERNPKKQDRAMGGSLHAGARARERSCRDQASQAHPRKKDLSTIRYRSTRYFRALLTQVIGTPRRSRREPNCFREFHQRPYVRVRRSALE